MRLLLYDGRQQLFAIKKGWGHIDREINVYDTLTVDLAPTKSNIKALEQAVEVGVPFPGRKEYQLFKVEKVDLNSRPISLTAIDAAAYGLDTEVLIRDRRFREQPLSAVLPAVFEGTTWNFKQFAPDTNDTISFYRISAKDALKKVQNTFQVETQFLYRVDGNKIADKTCEIHKQIGKPTTIRLVQGHNVTKVDYTQDQTQLFTAAMGRGAGLQNTDDSGEATGGYSRSVEFADVVWSKANGDPVDKPAGQDYVEIPEATAKYGWLDKDGKRQPRITKFEFDDEKDVNKLLKETYEKLVKVSQPQVLVETTVAKIGERVRLGDDVTVVIYEPYKLTYRARVIKMEENPDDEAQTTVTVGFSTVERQAERELDQQEQQEINNKHQNENLDNESQKLKRKMTEVDKNASEQAQKAQKAIRAVEEQVGQEIDDVKQRIENIVNQNSSGSPLEFYGTDGQIVSGIPPVAYIKSKDGSFELNSRGFNWGGRLLGGDGQLYADGIVGEKIVGYDIEGAHVSGGSFDGCTFNGKNYFRSEGNSGVAVMSGDYGFSYTGVAIGANVISCASGNWSSDGFYTPGHVQGGTGVFNGGVYIGGQQLTSSDIAKLHRLKG